jgi:prolyl oligopeptidase
VKRTLAFLVVFLGVGACGGEAPLPPVPPLTTATASVVEAPPVDPEGASYAYPVTRREDRVDTIFGTNVQDPYRWLEDDKSDEVKKWMSDEDAFARAWLTKLPGRDEIAARFKELFYVESVETPQHHGTRWFFPRRDAGKEKWVVYWREGKNGADKVLLDPNQWSNDGSVSLGQWSVSWDGRKVAYSVHSNNSDEATLYVMDVATGKQSEVDVIEGAKYASPSWTPRGDAFYYTWVPTDAKIATADRPGFAEVRLHKLGTLPTKDEVVHERTGDPKTFIAAEISRDGRWLCLSIEHGWTKTDVWFEDLRAVKPEWKALSVDRDSRVAVEAFADKLYLWTNEGAPKYRLFRVDPAHPQREQWVEIVPERKDATLEGFKVVGGKLSLGYLKDASSLVEVRDTDGKLVRELELPTIGTASVLSGNPDEDEAYWSFASFTYPTEIYETSVRTGATKLWYKLKVPVDPTKYDVEQRFAHSKDGTRVPMFIVHAKGMKKDGSAPTILYGYGGFQSAQTPYFSSSIYPWLERGGVYVVANLRGGSEYGEEWHRAGMRRKKQNVFDDFVAVAEDIVKEGYTRPEKLAIRGGSNGGLLVGAALTQRPDLFKVALCGVPLLDMVRYHQFGSGKTWIEEYGSADDADDFKAIVAYSPYHHVKKGTKYPSTLVLSADADDRVDPMHARKFAALLQWASAGGPVLLRIEKHSGHTGADLVRASVEKLADEYAFALSEMEK